MLCVGDGRRGPGHLYGRGVHAEAQGWLVELGAQGVLRQSGHGGDEERPGYGRAVGLRFGVLWPQERSGEEEAQSVGQEDERQAQFTWQS